MRNAVPSNMDKFRLAVIAITCLASALPSCAAGPSPARTGVTAATSREESEPIAAPAEIPSGLPMPETKPPSVVLAPSETVLQVCELNLDSVDKAPKFDIDSSELLPADLPVLKQLVECFTTGPMKGFGIRLTGRADSRGAIGYNDVLGMKRAKEVGAYLKRLGIERDRIHETSRGKRDASGNDESTWARDRRVDIVEAP